MSDNSWYENDKIPPVGTKCIADFTESRNEFLKSIGRVECEIVMHSMCAEEESETAVFRWKSGKAYRYHAVVANSNAFRPIKTERELAIESALKVFNVGTETDKLLFTMAGALFDAGLLRSKNES